MLVSAEELAGKLERVRVVDARPGLAGYAAGHVAGAVPVDLDRDLSGPSDCPERGGRHPLPSPEAFGALLGRLGIGPDTEVVVYDEAGGALAAARLWWMLRAIGHERVSILDGGLQAAQASGLPIEREPTRLGPGPPYPVRGFALPTVSIDEVRARAGEASSIVLDVREPARWRGEVEPIDPVPGHIPGSVNLFFGENLGPDGRFLSPDALAAKYRAIFGEVPAEQVIVHCGSGVTACHTLFALDLAGLSGAALYVGSWSEWCRRSDRDE